MRRVTRSRPEPYRAVDEIGPSLQFLRLIWAIDHGLSVASKRMQRTLRITGPQRLVLRFVGCFPGVTAGRLANLLCLHPGTLTVVLAALEAHGLVERVTNPDDGRSSLIHLTTKGRRFDASCPGTIEYAVERTLAHFPSATIDGTKSILAALAKALQEDVELPAFRARGKSFRKRRGASVRNRH